MNTQPIIKPVLLLVLLLLLAKMDFAQPSAVSVTIGTLPKNKSIQIQYKVTVNSGLPANTTQVSTQGSATGTNSGTVLTDDPDAGGTADPTITLVDLAPYVVSIARKTPTTATAINATSVVYLVTFSEPVTGVNASKFSLITTGTISGASVGSISTTDNITWDVAVSVPTGDGTVRLDLTSATGITDAASNTLAGAFTTGELYTFDHTAPAVTSINRYVPLTASTNATAVTYRVTFSEAVTGVSTSNFSLTTTGTISGASISSVSGSNTTYDVAVSVPTGDGTVRLNLSNTTGITDAAGNTLAGPFTTGELYTIDHTPPTVVSINRHNPATATTTATTLTWKVTFSEAVTGVSTDDFLLVFSGAASGSIASVSGSSTEFLVTANGVSGDGGNTVGLNLKSGTNIEDLVGNDLSGGFTGQTYTLGVPPEFTSCPTTKSFTTDANQCYATVTRATLLSGVAASGSPDPDLTVKVGTTVVSTSYQFPIGNTTVAITASNGIAPDAECSYTVTVTDGQAPTITGISTSASILWPPNHKMQVVTVNYTAADNCPSLLVTSLSVSSNEPVNGTGDGDTDPDWIVDNNHQVQLRAERANNSPGRIYTITITATDGTNTTTETVTVSVAHNITAPLSGASYKLGSTVPFAGTFWDKAGNKHTANWLIDGSTTVKGTVTEPSGNKNGKVTGSYKFGSAGVYKLQMNVTDQNKVTSYVNTNEDLEAIVVVYDPNGGYTYGGGHFASPAGALPSDPQATGKVSYGFAVNYFKGATLPKGETQFEFKVGSLEYNALNFDYLAISGARAQFKGTGKIIGGQSGIDFIMTVIDGQLDGTGTDKVRIRIFNRNTGHVYYDNEPALSEADDPKTKVGAGSQVVIKGGTAPTGTTVTRAESLEEGPALEVRALPNPTHGDFHVFVRSDNKRDRITLQVFDQWGRKVEQRTVAGELTRLGAAYRPGTYFLRVVQGGQHREVRLLRLPD